MAKRILVLQGHPDPSGNHFGHALAAAYMQAAQQAGHEVRETVIARLDFPLLRTKEDWVNNPPPPVLKAAQDDIVWAEHIVILYPLWLGTMPAVLKAFLEQVLRPNLHGPHKDTSSFFAKPLRGRTAHIIVTMGMPALIYRWFFGAHSLKSLERNVLRFVGIKPLRESLIGLVEGKPERREKWIAKMRRLGAEAG